ncbi:MAG: DotI/IcmL/TraM family protein, partial [Pseudomonadota bacterium]
MDDPLERQNTDGRFYVWLTVVVTVIVVGVAMMVVHQRGGIYGPPPPNVEDLRRDRLAAPGHEDQYIRSFAEQVMAASVTFDARTFHNQMADLEGYFTPDGWVIFNRTLERLEVVDLMRSGRFSVTPSLNGDAVITGK